MAQKKIHYIYIYIYIYNLKKTQNYNSNAKVVKDNHMKPLHLNRKERIKNGTVFIEVEVRLISPTGNLIGNAARNR